jgi:lipid-binding SYLF domain-containing protein
LTLVGYQLKVRSSMKNDTCKLKSVFTYRTALIKTLAPSLIFLAALLAPVLGWADVSRSELDARLVRSAESFENVANSKARQMPHSLLAKAQGIIIFREYGGGFIWGGKGGFGIAMRRQNDGRWGAPAFLSAGEGSFGLQIGVQRQDLVFLFMTSDSLKIFDREKFKVGVDVAAAAGPVGANAQADLGTPVLVYSDSSGLYAGATFKGGYLGPNKDANEKFYSKDGIRVPQILRGEHVKFPSSADELRQDLEDYESNRSNR